MWFVCFLLKSPQINRFIGTFHLQIFHTSLRKPVMCCSMKIQNTRSSNIGPKHMIFELKNIFFILCVWVFWMYVCLCTTCVQCLRRPDEGSEWLGVGDTDSCEPLCRHRELNQSPLEEWSMLLTTKAYSPTLDVCTFYRRPYLLQRWGWNASTWKYTWSSSNAGVKSLGTNWTGRALGLSQAAEGNIGALASWASALLVLKRAFHISGPVLLLVHIIWYMVRIRTMKNQELKVNVSTVSSHSKACLTYIVFQKRTSIN